MYMDKQLIMADKQTVGTSQAEVAFTNVIDLGKLGVGRGRKVKLFCEMNETLGSASTDSTIIIAIAGGTTASLGTPLWTSATLTQAVAVAGYRPPQLNITLPPNCPRFIGGTFTIGTRNPNAGSFTVAIVEDDQSNEDPVALGLTS
jgi:hypothetical protein